MGPYPGESRCHSHVGGGYGLSLPEASDRPGAGEGSVWRLRLYGDTPGVSGGHSRLAAPPSSLGHWRGYGDSHLQRGTGPLHRRCGVYGAGGPGHSPAACLRSVYRRRNTARERSLQQRPPAAAGAL